MEVLGPKGPHMYTGSEMVEWAHSQLTIAEQIVDNPGGGLIFATTSVGQVRAALGERAARSDEERHRWEGIVRLLDQVEDDMVRRRFVAARAGLRQALEALSEEGAPQSA
jgi:hypothetical protein